MPNWAYTQYKIVGKMEEVQDLYSKLQELQNMEEPLEPNSFGVMWLGCLVTILGGNWNEIYCRGHIINFSLEDGILSIETETAWGEMDEVRHFIEKIYNNSADLVKREVDIALKIIHHRIHAGIGEEAYLRVFLGFVLRERKHCALFKDLL